MGSALGYRGEEDSSVLIVLCQGPFRVNMQRLPVLQFLDKFPPPDLRTCRFVFADVSPVHCLYRKIAVRFVRIVSVERNNPAPASDVLCMMEATLITIVHGQLI